MALADFNLITDRTQADVNYVRDLNNLGLSGMTAAELAEYLAGLKGAYNATDLNRVGAAVSYIASRFVEYGYSVTVTAKQDWTVNDIPTEGDLAYYLSDIAAIRDVISVIPTTPAVPTDLDRLTYTEANDIEQILVIVDTLITNMTLAWFYSGEVFSGEV